MSASVALLVSVGGITRLTQSGLSIVEWKPITGMLPPITKAQWEQEFAKYQAFPQFQMVNQHMSLDEFKPIFFWEWFHRFLGRLVGLGFFAGLVYHRRVLRGKLLASCIAILLGIGAQGALGWYMVKSGLEHKTLEHEPRVKTTRLTAHLGAAFLLFSGMLWTGLGQILKPHQLAVGEIAKSSSNFSRLSGLVGRSLPLSLGMTALVFTTALSGALVAGTRAGFIYNTFPLMGERLAPPASEYFALEPKSRNLVENDTAVQFNHRVLGVSTLTGISLFAAYLLKHKQLLPKRVVIATHHLLAFGWLQVILGISTLVLVVPTELAAAHQLGSLAVLSSALWLSKEMVLLKKYIKK